MTDNENPVTTRKDLMRPAQLLGLAAICAIFAGVITAVSLGAFQARSASAAVNSATMGNALIMGLVAAGIAFIAVLLIVSLLLLAVKPSDVTKTIDSPVLYSSDKKAADDAPEASGATDENAS